MGYVPAARSKERRRQEMSARMSEPNTRSPADLQPRLYTDLPTRLPTGKVAAEPCSLPRKWVFTPMADAIHNDRLLYGEFSKDLERRPR